MEDEKQSHGYYCVEIVQRGKIFIMGNLLKIKDFINNCQTITDKFWINLKDHLGFKNIDDKDELGNYIISDNNYYLKFIKRKSTLDYIYVYNKKSSKCVAKISYLKKN